MKNKGKRLLSRIVAACFALLLTVSMAIPAHAAIDPEKTYTITVNGKATDDGAKVDVYKIIEVNYDYDVQQPKDPAYRWVAPIASWLKTQEKLKGYVGKNNEVHKSFAELTGLELSNVMKDIEKAIREGTIIFSEDNHHKDATINGNSVSFSGMEMGQYLILTTANAESVYKDYTYVPVTANITPVYSEETKAWSTSDASVTIKGSPASIEKEVEDPTVEIGQKAKYKVTVPVPYYPEDAQEDTKVFRIGDYLPIGITFENIFDKNQLTVSAIYENEDSVEIATSADFEKEEEVVKEFDLYYYAKDNKEGGVEGNLGGTEDSELADFILDFHYDKLIESFGKSETGSPLKAIEVTYEGTINKNAIIKPENPDDKPLENKAYVGKNNNPYNWDDYDTIEVEKEVYTYAIDVTKVAEVPEGEEPILLSGAEFELLREDKKTSMKFVKTEEGMYRLAEEGEEGKPELVVGEEGSERKGKLLLEGLATGTYYLKETKAPDGYGVLEELIPVEIVDGDKDNKDKGADGIVDNSGDVKPNHVATNIVYKTVTNRKPPIMPITGGMGTVIFSVVGIVLVVGGVTLIASYLRRKRA